MPLRSRVFPPSRQASGTLGGGRIKESKPLGFSGEAASVVRVGPLYYWAWADVAEPALIDEHPHQVFEIVTYVIAGAVDHRDSGGHSQVTTAGGLQVMQTGSGLWHGERIHAVPATFFQIWFEPERAVARQTSPRYLNFPAGALPRSAGPDAEVVRLVGPDGALRLASDVRLDDVRLSPGQTQRWVLAAGRALAMMIVDGSGVLRAEQETAVVARDFCLVEGAGDGGDVDLRAADGLPLRLVVADVPLEPGYPLFHKRRVVASG